MFVLAPSFSDDYSALLGVWAKGLFTSSWRPTTYWGYHPNSQRAKLVIRCVGLGPQFRYVNYDPSAPLHDRYRMDTDLLSDADKATPDAYVDWEDNHYESEADSVQGLLLTYLRTGDRAWMDWAEAWARYHKNLQSWRTDGWSNEWSHRRRRRENAVILRALLLRPLARRPWRFVVTVVGVAAGVAPARRAAAMDPVEALRAE